MVLQGVLSFCSCESRGPEIGIHQGSTEIDLPFSILIFGLLLNINTFHLQKKKSTDLRNETEKRNSPCNVLVCVVRLLFPGCCGFSVLRCLSFDLEKMELLGRGQREREVKDSMDDDINTK